jgi:hypothetical protein
MGRLRVPLLGLVLALGCAAPASAFKPYPWPVRPFHQQHAIRGFFGDPRTVFEETLLNNGIDGPGDFSFHNGIDIAAADGTKVYPVVSGVVHLIEATAVSVQTLDGRSFQYFHVVPTVVDGERAIAGVTVLGEVEAPYGHVHLSEIDGSYIRNPLLAGHLAPYVDHTRPVVSSIELRRTESGSPLGTLAVCGKVAIVASALDRPPLPVPGAFAGLPVAPAYVAWRLQKLGGPVVVPDTVAADFRRTLPADRDFWNVYARGTYENAPRFGNQQFRSMPGRYIFNLSTSFDTKTLANGVYVITVTAGDERGNLGVLAQRVSVLNIATPTGCPVPPAPPPTTTTSP